MAQINIKTQTARSTHWKTGFNCVNLFLSDRYNNTDIELGLRVTEWGDKYEIKPKINVRIDGNEYEFELEDFKSLIRGYK